MKLKKNHMALDLGSKKEDILSQQPYENSLKSEINEILESIFPEYEEEELKPEIDEILDEIFFEDE